MNKKITFGVFVFTYALVTVSCVHYAVRDIRSGAMPDVEPLQQPHDCQIEVASVIDKRPIEETKAFSQKAFRYFIPAIIWWQWESAGPVYAKAKYYDSDLITNLKTLISNTLEQSNITTGKGKRYILKTELLHYYGVSYVRSATVITYGAAAVGGDSFFPTGFVALKLTLIDGENSTEIASRYLTDSFLFNPENESLAVNNLAVDNSTQVATLALKRAMAKFPKLVEQMLTSQDSKLLLDYPLRVFKVIRLSSEYDFQEELDIEFATGRIIRNKMIKRSLPIISRPNEWVVVPILNGRWLTSQQYKSMIQTLRKKYIVEFKQNITAANFYGIQGGSHTPVPKREYSIPPNITMPQHKQKTFIPRFKRQLQVNRQLAPRQPRHFFTISELQKSVWVGNHFIYSFINRNYMLMKWLRNTDKVVKVPYHYNENTGFFSYNSPMGSKINLQMVSFDLSKVVWKNSSGKQFVWVKEGQSRVPQGYQRPLPSSRFHNPAEGLNDADGLRLSRPGND